MFHYLYRLYKLITILNNNNNNNKEQKTTARKSQRVKIKKTQKIELRKSIGKRNLLFGGENELKKIMSYGRHKQEPKKSSPTTTPKESKEAINAPLSHCVAF